MGKDEMNRAESYARLKARRPGIEAAEKEIAPYEAIADLLLDARIRAGLTQAELAKRAGTTQARISGMESGEANTKLETLMRIGEALGPHIDRMELLHAIGRAYLAVGHTFVTLKTPVSTFETIVTLGAAETVPFSVTADAGLPLFDAENILVGSAMTPGSVSATHLIAPGFVVLKDVAFSTGITFAGGGGLGSSLLAQGFTFAGKSLETTGDDNGDDEPETPSKARSADDSELALAA